MGTCDHNECNVNEAAFAIQRMVEDAKALSDELIIHRRCVMSAKPEEYGNAGIRITIDEQFSMHSINFTKGLLMRGS